MPALVLIGGCAAAATYDAAARADIVQKIHPLLSPAIVGQPVDAAIKIEGGVQGKTTDAGGNTDSTWSRDANAADYSAMPQEHNYGASPHDEWCTEVIKVSNGTVTDWHADGALCK